LYELKCKKHTIFSLTIVGEGPEKIAIEKKVESLGLKSQVNFVGIQKGETLVELLNQHKVICIPSKWEEPFGIVALEALA
ncbi:glycosyltransferase, partial [Acinetobacter baumannii]